MQSIRIEKITLNIGVGGPGEKMEKALKLLGNISGMKPVQTSTKKRIPGWDIRPGLKIGCKVTLRGKKAEELLRRLLEAKNKRLELKNFDKNCNFSFGVEEYLDVPGVEYDMQVGIMGFETAVTLIRPGFRISKRKIRRVKLPSKLRISKEEAISFIKGKYSIRVGGEE